MVATRSGAVIVGEPPPHTADLFHFHPRATNPELWRTTVPLVVRERCRRHKGLITTWTAIHWLIVLHAASGRAHFGVREIAEEAGVGRNELAGPTGYIQRLVDLGLLRIVGHKSFRGLREPRPVYHIDLIELERLSLELVPDVLRDRQIDRPPPAAPDPRQLHLALPSDDGARERPLPLPGHPWPDEARGGDACQEQGPGGWWLSHEAGTADLRNSAPLLFSDPTSHGIRTDTPRPAPLTATPGHGIRTGAPPGGTQPHVTVPERPPTVPGQPDSQAAVARKRDMDGEKDRMNEGASQALTPEVLRDLVAQTTAAVIAALQPRLRSLPSDTPPALAQIPPPPTLAGPLNASVFALWQGDGPEPRQRDIQQLALLAAEYDEPTGGHGAYWLGRAILMADLCLGGEQPVTIAYLRRMLRRWREEGSWGSDREAVETPRPPAAPAPRSPATPPPDLTLRHPAVRAYVEALHETPNAVQAAQIAETVADLSAWRQVLTDWQLNGWGERSVGKMLDRYLKSAAAPAPAAEPPPSVAAIHTYPGLAPEQRDRWIRKFHAAATPAEKRAVLSRLEQEHPR